MIDTTKTVGTAETFNPLKIKGFQSEGVINSIATLEKAIFCLEYLGQLQQEGLDFIFKGGSAVQVLLGERWTRLSVDVDICTVSSKRELENILERIHSKFNENTFSYSPREMKLDSAIPFYSYRIETPAIADKSRRTLLDVMGTRPKFATLLIPLRTSFFDSSTKVATPTIGALLGDKLSTIGPTTIGRRLSDSRNGLEYAKHFHDINSLKETDFKMKECIGAFHESVYIQSKVRKTGFTLDECLHDMVFTCQVASLPQQIGDRSIEKLPSKVRARAHSEFSILRAGLPRCRPFLSQKVSYTWDDLRRYAAQTALMAKMIQENVAEDKAKAIVRADSTVDKSEIKELIKDIERLPEKEHWFVEPGEIANFPKILKLWHDYFFLENII